MGALKVVTFAVSVFLLYIGTAQAQAATTPMQTTPMPGGGEGTTSSGMMEDWKIVAIVIPCVVGGLALLICLCCCCCCQGGAGGGQMMCCDPNGGCGPMCDPNCCGPMCDCNACCGPQCCDPNGCCGPQCCHPNGGCGPMCDCNACCGPMCDPAACCGPQCCGPCCVQPAVHGGPVINQYATRGQIWPQQAYNYRCGPPGAVGGGSQCVSNVPVNGGAYGRSLDTTYGSGPVYGGGAQCGPCQQQPRYPARF